MIRIFFLTTITIFGLAIATSRIPSPKIEITENEDLRNQILERTRTESKLVTATTTMSADLSLERSRSFWGIPLGSRSLFFHAVGDVQAGIDLSKISEEDISFQENRVAIALPPVEIISVRLDADRSQSLSQQAILPEMFEQVMRSAEREMVSSICQTDLIEQAELQAQEEIERLLELPGIEVDAIASRGICD